MSNRRIHELIQNQTLLTSEGGSTVRETCRRMAEARVGARARLASQVPPAEVAELKAALEQVNLQKEEAVRDQNFERAAGLRDQEREIQGEILARQEAWERERQTKRPTVNEEEIAFIVSRWTGIPVTLATVPIETLDAAQPLVRRGSARIRELAPPASPDAGAMAAAPFVWREGRPDWGAMWTTFCDLALHGGPPHRGPEQALRAPAGPASDSSPEMLAELVGLDEQIHREDLLPEVPLVELGAEHDLVEALQLREREARRQELEADRRVLTRRIAKLRRELEHIDERRRRQRSNRNELPVGALAGYTNAGKSTLFNRLTRDAAFAEDRLFATLDSRVRRGAPRNRSPAIELPVRPGVAFLEGGGRQAPGLPHYTAARARPSPRSRQVVPGERARGIVAGERLLRHVGHRRLQQRAGTARGAGAPRRAACRRAPNQRLVQAPASPAIVVRKCRRAPFVLARASMPFSHVRSDSPAVVAPLSALLKCMPDAVS